MRGRSIARLCQHGSRWQTIRYQPHHPGILEPMIELGHSRRSSGSPKNMERVFFSIMKVREQYFALNAPAQPDDTAKVETLRHAADGKPHPAVEAFHNDSLAFGFSAGGLLFPYYIGMISGLDDLGITSAGKTHLAGASAGSLIAGCYHAGIPVSGIMEATMELIAMVRKDGVYMNLGPALKTILEKHLPEDAHERCNGVTHVAVTRILPCALPSRSGSFVQEDIQQELVTQFETRDDLIAALLTSCHIPIYFTGSFARQFRGKLACDGGLSNFLPTPSVAQYAVRGVHVSPDCFDNSWAGIPFSTLLSWALAPASDEALYALHDKGRADAAAWARLTGVGDAAAPDHDDLLRYNLLHDDLFVPPPCDFFVPPPVMVDPDETQKR